jgi:magnesium transporter
VITSRIYRDGRLQEEKDSDAAAVEAGRVSGDRIRIDVVEPTDEELGLLQATLKLHELSVVDSRRWGQRPKVEFYPDHVFIRVLKRNDWLSPCVVR